MAALFPHRGRHPSWARGDLARCVLYVIRLSRPYLGVVWILVSVAFIKKLQLIHIQESVAARLMETSIIFHENLAALCRNLWRACPRLNNLSFFEALDHDMGSLSCWKNYLVIQLTKFS